MLDELERRRKALVLRSTAQRAAVAGLAAPFASKLAFADRALATVRSHPVAFAVAAAGLALAGRRGLLRWALRGLAFASLLRRL